MFEGDYWNPIIEAMEPYEQREMQSAKLKRQLSYILECSPFYRQKFDEAGFDAARVGYVSDLLRAPFTRKEELRESQIESPPLGEHAAADMRKVVRIHSSSGTTGRPSYVGITRHDRDVWTEVVSRVYYCEGLHFVRGVDVWPSAVADVVVGCLRPRTTGAVQILLGAPGPKVDPPLKLQAEYGPEATDLDALKRELEGLLRARLVVDCDVDLMPPGTLPRFEMKAQPIRRLYDEPLLSGGG